MQNEKTKAQAFEILDVNPIQTYQQCYNRYRYLVKKHHPDKGGNPETFNEIQLAWEHIRDSLPKFLVVVLLVTENCYKRWIHDGTIHGNWIQYAERDNAYHLIDRNHAGLYEIPEGDKVLQDGVNCEVRLVERDEWVNKYIEKRLWICPMNI